MTDEIQAETPKTDKMAAARAAKAAKKAAQPKEEMVPVSMVLDLQRRLAELESKSIPTTIPEAPPASAENRPGSYTKVWTDKTGNDLFRKVRWNKTWMEQTYPMVTFTPSESMIVLPHGVKYELQGAVEITVPSIVRTTFEDQLKQRANLHARYRGWRSGDRDNLEDRVNDNPGTRQWSRVARLPAIGIDVNSGGWEAPKESNSE